MNETYTFVKNKSRSRIGQSNAPTPKRRKTDESTRLKRISELEEDLKDFNDRLKYKEKMRDSATSSRNYKLCDQVTEEMSSIKKNKREAEQELAIWQRKQEKDKGLLYIRYRY